MATPAELKQARTKGKSSLSRIQSKIHRYIAESNKDDVVKYVAILKEQFKTFEDVHDKYHETLDAVEEIEASDGYMIEVESKYAEALSEADNWLTSLIKVEKKPDAEKKEAGSDSIFTPNVLSAINLPKLELCTYNGDPLQYYPFITAFDETVDTVATTGGAKLNRLVSYTTGEARKAIQSCLIIGGEKGYQIARKTLKERFGDDLAISQAIICSLKDGGVVKSPSDLRRLSDELVNSSMVLTRLGSVLEVESQQFIASIINRLPAYMKNKWKKAAMDKKGKDGRYPDFNHLVTFVQNEASSASDPIYGDSGLLTFTCRTGQAQQSSNSNPKFCSSSAQQRS